jgi:xanthine dehydrogenase/oxidase
MPVLAADGCHVTTVEGIGSVKGNNLHPVQQAMVDMHGSQCGFCTPGIIVSLYTLLSNNPTVEHVQEHLDGNLCRCTGYRPIWDAARSLCVNGEDAVRGPCGTPCLQCPQHETCEQDCNVQQKKMDGSVSCCSSSHNKMKTYKETFLANRDWLDQPSAMFPRALLEDASEVVSELGKPLLIVDSTEFHRASTWVKPTSLVELLELLHEFDACKLVVGNTEVGIEARFKHAVYPCSVHPSDAIRELFLFEASDSMITIGSCCTLSTIQQSCMITAREHPLLARTVMPMHDMLRWFASTQIRNVACLGGNLVTASPISDMNPMLAAMGGKLVLSSSLNGAIVRRRVDVAKFFLKYRTVDLEPNELVECIEIPVLQEVFEYLKPFKQARRREDDISIVTAAMRIRLRISHDVFVIEDVALAFGGMAPVTVMATETAITLVGSEFNADSFAAAQAVLLKELGLPETVPGGQAAFRMALAASFLYKFYIGVVDELTADVTAINKNPALFLHSGGKLPSPPTIGEAERTAADDFLSSVKPNYRGIQRYPVPRVAQGLEVSTLAAPTHRSTGMAEVVGKASSHMSGPLHCTGEALYTDDIPLPPDTLQAALVLASECGGIFESIDTAPALGIPGVFAVYTAADIESLGGSNVMGPIVPDEVVFLPLGEKVRTVGQVLGIVVSENLESAELAARSVIVQYAATQEKIVVTIDDAIEAGSFYDFARHRLERGDRDVLSVLSSTVDSKTLPSVGQVVKVSGSCRTGPQEHFYLETNSVLVVPSESDTNLTVYASTQAPTKTQSYCASATGTPASKVVVRVKRMGGGFGGKETRSVFASAAAAVAAKRSSRPVRLTLARDVDMKITGTRHAFMATYHASAQVTEDGVKLVAFDAKIYSNGGCAYDLSGPVMDRALFHVDGCYYYPHFRAEGVPCKTAQAPHTAFRGFGGPQGMVIAEHVIDHLALACDVSGDELRRNNMYKDGDHIPFGMIVGEKHSGKWNIPVMWERLWREVGLERRRQGIDAFNAKNKWTKRGLAFLPTKFGIAFTAKFMVSNARCLFVSQVLDNWLTLP